MGEEIAPLSESEQWWAARYEFLKEQGYMLRPRYRPGWKPRFPGHLEAYEAEDGQALEYSALIDAQRMSDSFLVTIKRVENPLVEGERTTSVEERMLTLFSNEEHASNAKNHCIPVLQVLHIPDVEDTTLLVMPLMRNPKDPLFKTIGEGVQLIKEIFEGVQYLHQSNIAHRDCSLNNVLMDTRTMFPNGFHPCKPSLSYDWKTRAKHFSRTRRPPRYYLIDFEFAEIYEPSKPRPLKYAIRSGGTEPPEAKKPCDPFATDVFLLGTMVRLHFLDGRPTLEDYGFAGFEFLRPLVNDMIQEDPSKRPTVDEAVSRLSQLIRSLSWYKLRSRTMKQNETIFVKPFRAVAHLFWTLNMLLHRRPAIPISHASSA